MTTIWTLILESWQPLAGITLAVLIACAAAYIAGRGDGAAAERHRRRANADNLLSRPRKECVRL